MDQTVKSSARTLDILELVVKHPEGVMPTDIHKLLDIPFSSLHGLLSTMVQRTYLRRDTHSGSYRLGPKLLSLAAAYETDIDLIALADPAMDRLRRLTHETASLTVLHHDLVVFIHKSAEDGTVQVVNPVGTILPAHATGSGKVMLAYLTEPEFDRLFPREDLPHLTDHTITSRSELKRELARVRASGYAFDDEEFAQGVWAVAACIRNAQGRPAAAISVVAPIFHVQAQNTSGWPAHVREAAAQISAALGFAF